MLQNLRFHVYWAAVTLSALSFCSLLSPVGVAQEADATNSRTSAQNKVPNQIQAIQKEIGELREVSDDKRGQATSDLATRIRLISPCDEKLSLALQLSWLCTEGDFGTRTIQSVADALEQTLSHTPPLGGTNRHSGFEGLARLVHYEGAKVAIETPELTEELKRLASSDQLVERPDFSLKDLDGKEWSVKALRGEVVLVNVWATWCPPCIKEIPDLQALYELHKENLIVLGVSAEIPGEKTEVNLKRLRDFVQKNKVTYPILYDRDGAVSTQLNVEGIPRTLVLDRDGKKAAIAVDMRTRRQLEQMLQKAGLNLPQAK